MTIDVISRLSQIISKVEITTEINETSEYDERREISKALRLAIGQLKVARTTLIKAARVFGNIGDPN